MISERNTDRTMQGNLTGDRVSMGIHVNAMAHIMSVLTDLYSDPELAVLREYSTNALDAHIQARVSLPIEVTLPSPLSPYLKIRDYGHGLSVDDIREIYSQYGASTKRESNDLVGMLGLGCKSALTYTDQFTLVSVKDGQRIQVSVTRDDTGGGSMTVVSQTPTDDASGVEVIVPARRNNTMERKAEDFFKYWQPGTVLVNGREPKLIEGLKVTDNITLVYDAGHQTEDYLVMGNVAYPCRLNDGVDSYRHHIVAHLPIGAFSFTPSREALQMTANTKAAIAKVEQEVKANLTGSIQKVLEEAPDRQAAIKAMLSWREVCRYRGISWTWRGEQIPDVFTKPGFDRQNYADPTQTIVVTKSDSYWKSRHDKCREVVPHVAQSAVWFYNYLPAKFTAGHKDRLLLWAEQNDVTVTHYILSDVLPEQSDWLDPKRIVDWADVAAIKMPRKVTVNSGRISGSYDTIVNRVPIRGVLASDIDTTKPVFYTSNVVRHSGGVADAIEHLFPGSTLVCFSSNREGKFVRDFPNAQEAMTAVRAQYDTWKKSWTEDDIMAVCIQNAGIHAGSLDVSRVDDPALVKLVEQSKHNINHLLSIRSMYRNLIGQIAYKNHDWKNPLDNYPLFSYDGLRRYPDHMYFYLNAAYAANKGGTN